MTDVKDFMEQHELLKKMQDFLAAEPLSLLRQQLNDGSPIIDQFEPIPSGKSDKDEPHDRLTKEELWKHDAGQAIEYGAVMLGDVQGFKIFGELATGGHGNPKIDNKAVRQVLVEDAARRLPPGTRFEVRQSLARNYGLSHAMAWITDHEMRSSESWPMREDGFDSSLGCMIVGSYVTPDE